MKQIAIIISFIISGNMIIFDFNDKSDISLWKIVDDVVMGGRSNGNFSINQDGHGVFSGEVSLDNDGGFSSVRHRLKKTDISNFEKIVLRVKGDGKRYQFRVKSDKYERYSYITYFQTTGNWQTIEIMLSGMYPTFRGIRLNMPNYPGTEMEELAFLIANKKEESFKLEIDKIFLK